jgi:putative phosphoribosyl transferase
MPTAERLVHVPIGALELEGDLALPRGATGLVLFAHGSGSSRHSPRNRYVARQLNDAKLGTLLIDLLTPEEEMLEARTRHLRFDIDLLARRLIGAIAWLKQEPSTRAFSIGCFGASTGAAAALVAAAERPGDVGAVVSRGGRPDLAEQALERVQAPTLLIVGGDDPAVIELNRAAMRRMRAVVTLEVVPGVTHLFEEPGTLEQVANLAVEWCRRHLADLRSPNTSLDE